ncbi:AAA family ATPase [Roseomonas genomospecies 6]|uniref:UvrD-like helicase C-terminal domain-containing protein n=1 Tax=Roseomonas genomospecies 6 TaxID=214106 RepID=A0A9W7NJ99_9PROT|nr:AAA family ATPase [Roseomonas genomospecies 6]KAA0680339.1 hypothetical protein DS843_13580 [Roseomonas genomospecies 6]
MRVVVRKIVSEREYGCIFAAAPEAEPDREVRVVAWANRMVGMPVPGEIWTVEGKTRQTERGDQIEADHAVRVLPTGRLIVTYLATHLPGIGQERAQRLWDAFRPDLGSVLASEANIDEIARVIAPDRPVLSVRLASAVVREWMATTATTKTVEWLTARGVENLRLALRVVRILGPSAVERLDRNPYCLVPVLSWSKVDELGLRLLAEAGEIAPHDDRRRLVGAVDAAIKMAIRAGHTRLTDEMLHGYLAKRLGVVHGHPRIQAAVHAGRANGAVVPDERGWRAPGCAIMEDRVVQMLRAMQFDPGPIAVPSQNAIKCRMEGFGIDGRRLHPEQVQAVSEALQRPVACLQGGAGTGKTFTTRAIAALWEDLGGAVLCCALSGKAALRLNQATKLQARTITRLLADLDRYKECLERLKEPDLDHHERERLERALPTLPNFTEKALLLCDEASMVDLPTMHAILRRLPRGARLLLVGDDCQLPPVGFGLIYHVLVSDPEITSSLKTVHRQTEASGIPSVAAAIRNRRMPDFAAYSGVSDGVSFVDAEPEVLLATVQKIATDLGGFDDGNLLCVTATNEGVAGIDPINRMFHEAHRQRHGLPDMKGYLGQRFSRGEPVIHLRNNYKRDLWNGSLGRITMVGEASGGVKALFDGQEHTFLKDDLIDLALAYGITCHKAQGSQARRVIIPIYPTRLLDPAWLYTAVTRAEAQAVLVGSRDALTKALRRPWATENRMVGLEWLGATTPSPLAM